MTIASRPQLLHWVLKTGNLKRDVETFYKGILGMHVLRHEEFSVPCAAECNGPFARPWSKTMIGYGEEDRCFVLELAFNYGLTKYPQGDDVRHIILRASWSKIMENVRSAGWPVNETNQTVQSNDGYHFHIVDEPESATSPAILGISLNVRDLQRSLDYYTNVLGMSVLKKQAESVQLGYPATNELWIELVETGQLIDHAVANGRLAIAVPRDQMDEIEKRVRAGNDKIHTERVSLDTPGKATVEVIILLDRDQYEICIVGAEAFFELCRPVQGGDQIDWQSRIGNGSKE